MFIKSCRVRSSVCQGEQCQLQHFCVQAAILFQKHIYYPRGILIPVITINSLFCLVAPVAVSDLGIRESIIETLADLFIFDGLFTITHFLF